MDKTQRPTRSTLIAVDQANDYREAWAEDKTVKQDKTRHRRTKFTEAGIARFNDYYDDDDTSAFDE